MYGVQFAIISHFLYSFMDTLINYEMQSDMNEIKLLGGDNVQFKSICVLFCGCAMYARTCVRYGVDSTLYSLHLRVRTLTSKRKQIIQCPSHNSSPTIPHRPKRTPLLCQRCKFQQMDYGEIIKIVLF